MLEVRLHEVVINDDLTLYLVTDLMDEEDTALAVASAYNRRYDVEVTQSECVSRTGLYQLAA